MGRHLLSSPLHRHNNTMNNLLLVLAVVGSANCAAVLKNPPSNAKIEYEHDIYGRLVEVDIDHHAPVPVVKKYAVPVPAVPAPAPVAVVKTLLAAPAAPSVQIVGPKVIYEMAAAPTPAPTPVLKAAPDTVTVPAVAPAPAKATYYKVDDDGELDRLDVAYVAYGAPESIAPAPVYAPAPAPVPSVKVYSLANPSAAPVLLPVDLD